MPIFLVEVRRSGPQWQPGLPLEEQSGWEEHAAFMDGLVDAGFILLGGPVADELRVFHAVRAHDRLVGALPVGAPLPLGCRHGLKLAPAVGFFSLRMEDFILADDLVRYRVRTTDRII